MFLAIASVGESLTENWHEDESSDCKKDHEKLQLELVSIKSSNKIENF